MKDILFDSRSMFHDLTSKYRTDLEWEKGRALFISLEYRCPATADHSLVVAFIASKLARQIFGDPRMEERMFLAGLLHDIGKVTMPDDILKSSRRLTAQERDSVITHVNTGLQALQTLDFQDDIVQFCLTHHERIDGSGYPRGITETSMIGRIASISDIYSALKLPRIYRPESMNDESIIDYLKLNSNQYDVAYVQILKEFLSARKPMRQQTDPLLG